MTRRLGWIFRRVSLLGPSVFQPSHVIGQPARRFVSGRPRVVTTSLAVLPRNVKPLRKEGGGRTGSECFIRADIGRGTSHDGKHTPFIMVSTASSTGVRFYLAWQRSAVQCVVCSCRGTARVEAGTEVTCDQCRSPFRYCQTCLGDRVCEWQARLHGFWT